MLKKILKPLYMVTHIIKLIIMHSLYHFKKEERKERIIISLTSYPKRFKNLYFTLLSIINQMNEKDVIVLYLYKEDYPFLPLRIKKLCDRGLVIKEVDEDIRSHKKYLYAFLEYPNDLIVTIDDDFIYEPRLLDYLYKYYLKYPNTIIAARVNMIKFENEHFKPYEDWALGYKKQIEPRNDALATGCGGILYPSNIIKDFDDEAFKKYAFHQDDLWLKALEVKQHIKVVNLPSKIFKNAYDFSYSVSLKKENIYQGGNDKCLNDLCAYFALTAKDFKE